MVKICQLVLDQESSHRASVKQFNFAGPQFCCVHVMYNITKLILTIFLVTYLLVVSVDDINKSLLVRDILDKIKSICQ